MSDVFLKKFAVIAALVISLILIMVKAFAWHVSDSVSLLSSLVDSSVDFLASFLNFLAIYHALKPASHHYRFGHGKVEAIAAMGQSIFIFASACFILKEAIHHFLHPHPIEGTRIIIHATLISLVLTIFLLLIQKHVIRKTRSLAIQADCTHYQSDLLINIGVLFVIGSGQYFDSTWLDPLFGAFVALYILLSSYKILKKSWEILMDRELSDHDRQKISSIITAHPMVSGYHLLRTRSSGSGEFIQCHLEMPGDITLLEAYNASQEVEKEIRKVYPKADIILHQDPAQIMEDHRHDL